MGKKKPQKAQTGKSFEQSLHRLEEIVDALEGGSLSLDKSIEIYSEGVGLIEACRKSLAEAEQKIAKLSKSGGLSTAPLPRGGISDDEQEGEE